MPGLVDPLLEDIDYVVHLADIVAGIGYVFNNQGSIFRQNVLINSNMVAFAVLRSVLLRYFSAIWFMSMRPFSALGFDPKSAIEGARCEIFSGSSVCVSL